MHASFSMRGKSYKMIQRRSSSRINDENFLLVLKKMSHNHFEGERTQKWPQEKYILKFSWIMPQDEQNKFSKIILFFLFMLECRNCTMYSHKMRTLQKTENPLAESWTHDIGRNLNSKGSGTQIAFSSSLYNATLLTQIFFWRLISQAAEWCRSKRDEILTVYKMNFASTVHNSIAAILGHPVNYGLRKFI